ncbi:MAG: hypothetical protein P8188_03090 [Gemmatimonadota bacterium]
MSPIVIRVLTFDGCPHAEAAKLAARSAAAEEAGSNEVVEIDLLAPTTPASLKHYPSPTVLVGSVDVSGDSDTVQGVSCRASGAPTIRRIRKAIRSVSARTGPG